MSLSASPHKHPKLRIGWGSGSSDFGFEAGDLSAPARRRNRWFQPERVEASRFHGPSRPPVAQAYPFRRQLTNASGFAAIIRSPGAGTHPFHHLLRLRYFRRLASAAPKLLAWGWTMKSPPSHLLGQPGAASGGVFPCTLHFSEKPSGIFRKSLPAFFGAAFRHVSEQPSGIFRSSLPAFFGEAFLPPRSRTLGLRACARAARPINPSLQGAASAALASAAAWSSLGAMPLWPRIGGRRSPEPNGRTVGTVGPDWGLASVRRRISGTIIDRGACRCITGCIQHRRCVTGKRLCPHGIRPLQTIRFIIRTGAV